MFLGCFFTIMRKRLHIIFIVYCLVFCISCNKKCNNCYYEGIKKSTKQIKTISINDTLFNDLFFFKDILENKRIIIIGEQAHGDGTSFLLKIRLIKYLNSNLGYDNLLFESNVIDFYNNYKSITDKSQIEQGFKTSVYSVWSETKEMKVLINYIKKKYNKKEQLNIFGFDCRISSQANLINIKNKIPKRILKKHTELNALLSYKKKQEDINLNKLYNDIYSILPRINDDYLKLVLSNLFFSCKLNQFKGNKIELRDRLMALNIKFLLSNILKNEKVIIWSANLHALKNIESSIFLKEPSFKTMGSFLNDYYNKQIYHLLITSSEGYRRSHYNKNKIEKLKNVTPNSLEFFLNQLNINYGFINCEDIDCKCQINANFLVNSYKRDWFNESDGILFIKKMYPSNYIFEESK